MSTIREMTEGCDKGFVLTRGVDNARAHGYGSLHLNLVLLQHEDRYGTRTRNNVTDIAWQSTVSNPDQGWYACQITDHTGRNWATVLDKLRLTEHMLREILKKAGLDLDRAYTDRFEPDVLVSGMLAAGYTRYVHDDRASGLVAYDKLYPSNYQSWSEGYAPSPGVNNPSKFSLLAVDENEARELMLAEWPAYLAKTGYRSDYGVYEEWVKLGRPVWSMTQHYYRSNGFGSFQPPTRRETDRVSDLLNIENSYKGD